SLHLVDVGVQLCVQFFRRRDFALSSGAGTTSTATSAAAPATPSPGPLLLCSCSQATNVGCVSQSRRRRKGGGTHRRLASGCHSDKLGSLTVQGHPVVLLHGTHRVCASLKHHVRRPQRPARTVVVHRRLAQGTKLRKQLLSNAKREVFSPRAHLDVCVGHPVVQVGDEQLGGSPRGSSQGPQSAPGAHPFVHVVLPPVGKLLGLGAHGEQQFSTYPGVRLLAYSSSEGSPAYCSAGTGSESTCGAAARKGTTTTARTPASAPRRPVLAAVQLDDVV
ncbi:unnamed protein product, partial [Ixodes hexagonus]